MYDTNTALWFNKYLWKTLYTTQIMHIKHNMLARAVIVL